MESAVAALYCVLLHDDDTRLFLSVCLSMCVCLSVQRENVSFDRLASIAGGTLQGSSTEWSGRGGGTLHISKIFSWCLHDLA